MPCPRCGHDNIAGTKFCGECGQPLAARCAACGAANPPTNKFCGECGGILTPAAMAPKFGTPKSYTPKHLAERILTSKAALEGERKQVTVLFADLKGSMEPLADRDPEEARKLLDPVLERMMEAVHRYEGTVNQVMGDGIMALFGAPLAHEDHAVRACYAALDMQAAMRRYAEEVRRSHGIALEIRVGLNSGEVVVRAIGSDLHMDYTAVGQTTHLAARMEQLADPGSILLTPETLALAEGFVQVATLGPMAVRGLSAPLEVYELSGASAIRSRLHATAARGLSRFVGRDTEMEQLRRALELARQGRGQVAALVGEPGVGKSRLVFELTHSHRVEGWFVLEAGSVSYGKATSYLPVIDLIKGYFHIGPRDPYRDIREKVTGKLLTLDRALESTLPALLALLDVPAEDPQWQALDPPQRRQRILDAVKRLVLREAQSQPLLVIFEDLHWIDSETQVVLDTLVESLPTARLLILVSYRPEYHHAWGSKTFYTQLRLDTLPPETAGELLDTLLGPDAGLASLKTLLATKTAGNPLFLEESVRTLVETKALLGATGAYRLAQPVETVRVPITVHAILAARIDRLPPAEKQLLETAAVIGKNVPFALLQPIAGESEETLRRGLSHLQAAEFLYETTLFPDLEYTFKHALTHEVTYGTLLQERRRSLHARIVDAIERVYSDRLTEHVERLAHHALRGEMWAQAVKYLGQAGSKATARSANREAVHCFEQALTSLPHLPETRETLEQAIDLRFNLRTSLFSLGEFERSLNCLREAESLARTLDDQRRLGQLSVYMCHNLREAGPLTEALAFGQRAQAIAESLGDLRLKVTGNLNLGVACLYSGDYRRAEDLLRTVLHWLGDGLSRERFGQAGFPAVVARCYLTWVCTDRGAFNDGIIYGQEGIRLAEAVEHPFSLIFGCWSLAYFHIARGEHRPAINLLERGLALSHEWNVTLLTVLEMGSLGYACALSGRVAEGISLLEHAVSTSEMMRYGQHQPLYLGYLAEANFLAGRPGEALAFAGRAQALANAGGQRPYEAQALRVLGEVAARSDLLQQADSHYHDALAFAEKLGMRPLVAHCHFGLGKLYSRTGDAAKATEHLTTAATMYREMGMDFWLKKAQAELSR